MKRLGIRGKLLLPIVIFAILIGIGVVWYVQYLAREQAVQTALDEAKRLSTQVQETREYYTKNVVAKATKQNLEVTHDYAQKPDAIPLPATMIHELNDSLSKREGYTIRLYSKYPFPHRQNGGPRDAFEEEALAFLGSNPQSDFWRREEYQGRVVVRYTRADIMVSNTCVACHNTHPSSPKTDWKLGDVRGALELIVPIDHAMAVSQAGARDIALVIGLSLLFIVGVMAFLTHRLVFAPLKQMTEASTRIAVGDIDQALDYHSGDEMGVLANAFRGLVDYIKGVAGAANALSRKDLTVTVIPKSERDLLSRNFERAFGSLKEMIGHIMDNTATLSAASEQLSATATQLGSNAEETSAQANVVSVAAEQVSKNVQTVATGTEEMSISIKEIARSAHEAAGVATEAVRVAQTTNAVVGKLGESSVEIGKVIKVITSIAEQTNLLALNATIEAARAGEVGKGFAVVANEVKELAKETAKATGDISQKIEAIQAGARGAVEAIGRIGAIIHQIHDYQSTIASAVEEQTATTNEISRNLTEAAKASAEIAQNIIGVAQAAQSTSGGAADSQRAATELARMAAELQRLVAQFRYQREEDAVPPRLPGGPAQDGADVELLQAGDVVWQHDRTGPNGRGQARVLRQWQGDRVTG
jgi:methyl-accepting chemotaxis protein